jgi:cytoskeletal protein CcmA (bactofilin family)
MSIWKEQSAPKREAIPMSQTPAPKAEASPRVDVAPTHDLPRRAAERESKESLIAADLTIEGKIEGSGHVRIAGRFKGDINVQGHLTIEVGAKVTGAVRANTVVIAGELEGNIDAAARVELLDSGVLNGDVQAGSLTVAAGSRMRGRVEFGWEEKNVQKAPLRMEISSAS